jgi:hypothetical protein
LGIQPEGRAPGWGAERDERVAARSAREHATERREQARTEREMAAGERASGDTQSQQEPDGSD